MGSGDGKARGHGSSGRAAPEGAKTCRAARAPLKVWVLSDIHLEFDRTWELPSPRPDFDVLVLAGDLVTRMERGVRWLRERLDDKPVVYISGNSEPYSADIDRTVAKAKAAAAGTNVRVLQNETCEIGKVRFAGCTLWTNFDLFGNPDAAMRAAGEQMNDYRRIRKCDYVYRLRPIDTLRRHGESCSFLASTLTDSFKGDTIVVTHHVPLRIQPAGSGAGSLPGAPGTGSGPDIIDAAYQSDLSYLITFTGPKLWIAGHVHRSFDTTVGATRVVTNPRGYGDEPNPDFDPLLTIEI